MLTGMPSTRVAKSVPWSRLKPRRKYWFALPSPLCCVTTSPGTASRTSAGLRIGRFSSWAASTVPSLAAATSPISARRRAWTTTSSRPSTAGMPLATPAPGRTSQDSPSASQAGVRRVTKGGVRPGKYEDY